MTLLNPRIIRQAEAYKVLGRKLLDDAVAAGWIQPCAKRQGKRGAASIYYSVEHIRSIEDRILAGELPGE